MPMTSDWVQRTIFCLVALCLLALFTGSALAQEQGTVPGNALGGSSDTDFWRAVRQGDSFTSSLPDDKAAVLVQSEGDNWRAFRNGPLSTYGVWLLAGFVAVVALFFLLRGRITIDHGWAGDTIQRFNFIERFAHWLTASSFIVLALTGLNLLYGRYWLLPLIGPEAFTTVSVIGKYSHNFLAFSFMIGIALMFVLWVRDNIPNRYDLIWLSRAGGLFGHDHPPSKKFNAGQKIVFWVTILGGISVSLSGWALLFPFEYNFFAKTFAVVNNVFGTSLPSELNLIQEQQLNQIWHTIVALIMIALIIGHIYIGSIGMQGAFAAMGSGRVDLNWAREHHNLWVEEEENKHRDAQVQAAQGSIPVQ